MSVIFTEEGWEDDIWYQDTDMKLLKRLNVLIEEIQRSPFDGTGKPESLRANLSGYWSRRVSMEHRLVYKVTEEGVVIVACRFHYRE
jgi:toxin YoeB